ncbi:MAG: FHA domain-containing protein [Propionibacteriaceae bacterium]|nr:FHA domain-containing protein [Propionibacteriaceae bacterium]
MNEYVILGLKIGFLALVWLLVLFVGAAIRTDVFGRKISTSELAAAGEVSRRGDRGDRKLARRLKIIQGPQAGLSLALGEPIIIGRNDDAQLILEDDYVSTHHARISKGQGYYVIEDLGSTNGTFVNNQRITVPTQVGTGDSVRIGQSVMVLEK